MKETYRLKVELTIITNPDHTSHHSHEKIPNRFAKGDLVEVGSGLFVRPLAFLMINGRKPFIQSPFTASGSRSFFSLISFKQA
jgi:hypothetical protein